MGKRIKALLAEGKTVRVFTLGAMIDPKYVEIVALRGGFDAFWLDHEHGGFTLEAAESAARAVRAAGLDSFVRMAPTDYATMMRFLEVGAGGIMAAQVRTAEEAEQVVSWVKFAPRGRRGLAGGNVDGDYGTIPPATYTERCNRETFVAIQIENAESLEHLDAIARVPDVDLLFVGPADLSQSLGITGQFEHPRLLAAYEKVAAASASAGVAWGTVALGQESARWMVERGCRMLEVANGVGTIHLGLQAAKARYPDLFPDDLKTAEDVRFVE